MVFVNKENYQFSAKTAKNREINIFLMILGRMTNYKEMLLIFSPLL